MSVFDVLAITRGNCWRRQWHPTLVLLPGKSHGWRSLVGCSPWGRKESDMTERLHLHFSLSCIGEGNGNPLLCSCLENPKDGGAWWAAVYGVAQSWTRLKWLSSSSSSSRGNCKIQKSISKLAMTVYRKQRKIGYFFKVQLFLSGHLMGLPLIFIWGAIHFSFFWKEEPTFPISPFWENSTPFPQIFFSF